MNQPKRRRARAELKELVLEAGVEVVRRDGLGSTTSTVTYQRVFDHLEETRGVRVTRGSVHERIWDSQREFQLDVIRRAALWEGTHSNAAVRTAAAEVLDEADLDTVDGRRRALAELWRRGGPANLTEAEERDHWSSWMGLVLSLSTLDDDSEDRAALLEAVADSYRRLSEELRTLAEATNELLGVEPRADLVPPHTDALGLLTVLTTALADGIALREQFTDDVAEVELATGPDGELERWHPFSIGIHAIADFFADFSAPGASDTTDTGIDTSDR